MRRDAAAMAALADPARNLQFRRGYRWDLELPPDPPDPPGRGDTERSDARCKRASRVSSADGIGNGNAEQPTAAAAARATAEALFRPVAL